MQVAMDQIIRQMTDIIEKELNPEAIILFGSQASGTSNSGSDIDLLIIDSIPFGPDHNRRRTLSRTRKALHQFLFPVDLLLYSRDEIEYWKDAPNHVVSRALREGRVLYERH